MSYIRYASAFITALANRISDVIGMVRWFFFKGAKPTFERWTYWEKFDFLAVFWGMFAIGGSGLMLWFPEFFGSLCPVGPST